MNLPNRITLIRLILIPFIVFFYLATPFLIAGKLVALILFVIATLTDFLDGFLARKLNQVTTLGIFLDNIADKMLVTTALILVICDGTIMSPFGAICAIIIILREFLVSAIRQLGASQNVIIAADMFGKVKACFQFFMLIVFILKAFLVDLELTGTVILVFNILGFILLGLVIISTIVSGVHYIVKNKNLFKKEKNEN